MHALSRTVAMSALLAATLAVPRVAPAQQAPSLTADLMQDLQEVEKKVVGLAKAIPADKYDWRPGEGVRSVSEVFMHIAADNYLLPAAVGHAAPAATGIKGDDYKTAVAFEKKKMDKDATVAELEKSFAHLRTALQGTSATRLGETVKLFGQTFSTQRVWLLTASHLHEHLGQMIAYARSNGVKPPWS
jgi:uncharacterized damage-inducible protein DinB